MSTDINDIHRLLLPLLVTGLAGTELTQAEREMLSEAPPAGVILFHRNVESIAQLRELTGEIRMIVEAASGLPPLIMADHEGGRISVLAGAIGVPPSQMAAWKPRSEELLSGVVANTSFLMRQCGINLTLSPVADVNSEPLNPVIGTRSFGEDPEEVSAAVRIAVRAIAGEGMLSCLKHFPGHGATVFDSHLTLPVIGRTIDQLGEEELPPFIAGIEEGADMVMTAHIALADGDPPASLDRRIVTGLLREKLGFEGVVITDALEMAGALPGGIAMKSIDSASGGSKAGDAVPAAIVARAIEAGSDLLLMSRPLEEVNAELALHAALGDELSTAALAESMVGSAARIDALRCEAAAAKGDDSPESVMRARAAADAERHVAISAVFETSTFTELAGRVSPEDGDGLSAPVEPAFIGDRSDFDSYVVKRFISGLLGGLSDAGLFGDPANALPVRDGEGPFGRVFDPQALSPVRADGERETGLYLFQPERENTGKASVESEGPGSRMLVLLCRKPLPEHVLRGIASGFDFFIAAERPWDAALFPPESPVIITYGTCDAAADTVVRMISGTFREGS